MAQSVSDYRERLLTFQNRQSHTASRINEGEIKWGKERRKERKERHARKNRGKHRTSFVRFEINVTLPENSATFVLRDSLIFSVIILMTLGPSSFTMTSNNYNSEACGINSKNRNLNWMNSMLKTKRRTNWNAFLEENALTMYVDFTNQRTPSQKIF